MIYVTIPLNGLEATFTRPLVKKIVRDLKDLYNIYSDKELQPSAEGIWHMQATLNEGGDSVTTGTVNNNTLDIDVDEEFIEEDTGSTFISQRNVSPVFFDPSLGVELKSVYMGVKYTIGVKLRTNSRNRAYKFYNDYRLKMSQSTHDRVHNVEYRHVLPRKVGKLLEDVYLLRENVAGYGDTFEDWLRSSSDGRMTWMSDTAGKKLDLGFKEKMAGVKGIFNDVPTMSKPEYDNGTGLYEVGFSYTVLVDKPTHLHVKYPIMIHNQMLDPEYVLHRDLLDNMDDRAVRRFYFDYTLKDIEGHNSSYYARLWELFREPAYDRWPIPDRVFYLAPIFTVMCQITEDDRRSLLNLRNLGDIELDSEWLDWMAGDELPYLTQLYETFVNVALYEQDELRDGATLTVDSNLNVSATEDLDLRKVYHIVFFFVTDPTIVSHRAWGAIREQRHDSIRHKLEYCLSTNLARHPGSSDRSFMTKEWLDKDRIMHPDSAGGYGPNFTSADTINNVNWNIRNWSMKTVMEARLITLRGD